MFACAIELMVTIVVYPSKVRVLKYIAFESVFGFVDETLGQYQYILLYILY